MRWTLWLLPVLGISQFVFIVQRGVVSIDTSYLVMALTVIGFFIAMAFSDYGCQWGGCDSGHCSECSREGCCGECECAAPAGEPAKTT